MVQNKEVKPRCKCKLKITEDIEIYPNGKIAYIKPAIYNKEYKVISGSCKGMKGKIIQNGSPLAILRNNEDNEDYFVNASDLKEVVVNYIDVRKHEKKQRDNEIIYIDAYENEIEVKIKDLKHEHYFYGLATCMEGDEYNYEKGCDIALCRARVEECIFYIEDTIDCYMNDGLHPIYSTEELQFELFKHTNKLEKLKNKLKELCR